MVSRYPPADDAVAWFGDDYAGVDIVPRVIVLHSTEGTGWPGYSGGASAPHLTCRPDFERERLVWRQHYQLDVSARALRNPAGGVQTNHAGAVQVEIVGTCDRAASKKWGSTPHLRMWDLPPWAVRDLGRFIRWCHDTYGIPLRAASTWPRYPSDDRARFTGGKWMDFAGVCGHLHVPENDHQDPGDITITEIMEAAAMTAAQDVWDCDTIKNLDKDGEPINPVNVEVQAKYALELTLKHARGARAEAADARNRIMGLEVAIGQDQHQLGFIREDVAALKAGIARLEAALAELLSRLPDVAE
jgi:hypothetical protein